MISKANKEILRGLALILLLTLFAAYIIVPLFAQDSEQGEDDYKKGQAISEKLAKDREKFPELTVEEGLVIEQPPLPELPGKVLIREIIVTGTTVFSEKEIEDIVLPYKNKKLDLSQIKGIARLITDVYHQQGYITSGAYISQIKIEQGILEIKVTEGLIGEISIEGNRYSKADVLKRRIGLKKGKP